MRRVTFQSVLHGTARHARLDPTKDLREPATSLLLEFINIRVGEGWRWDFWPEWTLCEARTRAGDATNGYYYDLNETGLTPIETVRDGGVSLYNPRVSPRAPGQLDFSITDTGILVPSAPATVYVQFRPAPPEFAVTVWSSTATYAAGDLRYRSNSGNNGETYLALQASTNKDPLTETAYWERVDFPDALSGYVKRAAAADYLRSQGNDERADALLAQANQELEDALDQQLENQGQYARAQTVAYGRW